ncbi:MAG: hypothetical protein IPG99_03805 [Ignavibacteria bacterium]|nr:hypothetical protein [Ignavibacteria bacterium]
MGSRSAEEDSCNRPPPPRPPPPPPPPPPRFPPLLVLARINNISDLDTKFSGDGQRLTYINCTYHCFRLLKQLLCFQFYDLNYVTRFRFYKARGLSK